MKRRQKLIEHNDWRLTNQENYLAQKQVIHTEWEPRQANWNHDHCAFCSKTIDHSTGKAYCTTDKYHWICDDCFTDFKDMFGWSVKTE
jgi:hypothetical protein